MKLVVHDACILIDLIEGSLFDSWPGLDFVPLTTSLVLQEISNPLQKEILTNSVIAKRTLIVEDLPGIELASVANLQVQLGRGLSLSDCSAIFLAKKHNATLLTADSKLRKTAEQQGLVAHGTLWIFDSLLERGLLTPQSAAKKLRLIQAAGSRLPTKDCETRLRVWDKTDIS